MPRLVDDGSYDGSYRVPAEEIIQRTPEEQRRYKIISNVIGTGGIASAVGVAGYVHVEAGKMALTSTEMGVGGLAIAGSLALMNVASAFHNAAKHSNGPYSSAVNNAAKINGTNMFGYVFASLMGGLLVSSASSVQQGKIDDQKKLAGLPHLDPNTVVREVTAQQEHCAGEPKGKVVTLDHKGRQWVFLCP